MSPWIRDDATAAVAAASTVTEWPSVSVVVPVFDAEEYLVAGLESVLRQSVAPTEVIVVDDGSRDRSAACADEVAAADARVRVVRQANRGPGAARNTGIAMACSDTLVFHDADDVMLPDRIAVQVGYLVTHPEVDVVIGSTRPEFDPDLDPESELVQRERLIAQTDAINLMVMAARRCAFAAVGGFDESYRLSEDVNWLIRAARAGVTVAFVPVVVVQRRIHEQNLSHDMGTARRESFRAIAEHMRARRAERAGGAESE